MEYVLKVGAPLWRWCGLGLIAGILTACGTIGEPRSAPASGQTGAGSTNLPPETLRVGDLVGISFSGSALAPKNFDERIKEDGTISPPTISNEQDGAVLAAGKTIGQLQKELQERYNKFYRNLTVTAQTEGRSFFVDGQVRNANRFPHYGEMSVVKAIAVAGGCTDFAKKTRLQLRRSDGTILMIDYKKALKNPGLDQPVYPGDTIYVPRRW